MSVQVVSLNEAAIGKKLGQKLYNSKGGLLLGNGAEIKKFHFSHIQQVGYKSIYVIDDLDADMEMNGHIISEKTRASAPIELKKIYLKLTSPSKVTVSDGKKDLNEVAASLDGHSMSTIKVSGSALPSTASISTVLVRYLPPCASTIFVTFSIYAGIQAGSVAVTSTIA